MEEATQRKNDMKVAFQIERSFSFTGIVHWNGSKHAFFCA
jgi:hypothetical protein